jgi:uncharacterized membrane protein YcgQ (UPF0703/DUF1980 family)
MSGTRTLVHLLSVAMLFLWGGVLLYFYASGRLVNYLPPDGIFRPMVLVSGIGLAVLGLFNLLTMGAEDPGCEGHDHGHSTMITTMITRTAVTTIPIRKVAAAMTTVTSTSTSTEPVTTTTRTMRAAGMTMPTSTMIMRRRKAAAVTSMAILTATKATRTAFSKKAPGRGVSPCC